MARNWSRLRKWRAAGRWATEISRDGEKGGGGLPGRGENFVRRTGAGLRAGGHASAPHEWSSICATQRRSVPCGGDGAGKTEI